MITFDGMTLMEEWDSSFLQWKDVLNSRIVLYHIFRARYIGWATDMEMESIRGLNSIFMSMLVDKDCIT